MNTTTLDKIANIYNGNSINADYKKKHFTGLETGYPFIATKDVSFNGVVNYDNGVKIPFETEYKTAEPGSVFICAEGGSAGRKIAYITEKVCFGNKLFCLQPKDGKYNGRYLYYYLMSDTFQTQFKLMLTGLIGGVSAKKFKSFTIPVLPIEEQERIVALLDDQFAKIDALKANAASQLQAAKDLFQSALKEYLTPKEGWERKKFGDLCKLVRGPFGGSLKKEIFVDKGYAVYEQQHAIYKNHDIRYYIPQDKYLSMKRFAVSYNDLIMSCSGTIGRIYVIPEDAPEGIINQALLKITIKKDILPNYLAVLMESSYFKEIIASYSDGAAIKNIAAVNVLKEIDLLVPPIDEQNNILARLDAISEKVKALQDNYDQTINLCNDLKQSLLKSIFE